MKKTKLNITYLIIGIIMGVFIFFLSLEEKYFSTTESYAQGVLPPPHSINDCSGSGGFCFAKGNVKYGTPYGK